MQIKLTLSVLLICTAGVPLFSQIAEETGACGTRGLTPWFEQYTQHRHNHAADNGGDTAWLYVPVTMHITGEDNGSGYYPLENALQSLCRMNFHYAPARIYFYLQPGDPVRYLNNSSWHEHDWEGGAEMIETNFIPGRLNIFIVADPAGNCGYSWIDAIVMAKGCSGSGNSTWAHEAGHHLSLPHTFYGWEGFDWDYSQPAPEVLDSWGTLVEKTDQSNCYDAGDYFCDTPPDYLNFRWDCNADGESNIVQHDPNGVPFRSDGTLLMSYSSIACRARFSAEQIAAMRFNLNSEHQQYLQLDTPTPPIDDSTPVTLIAPLDTQAVTYNDFTLQWETVENATFYTVDISLNNNLSFQPRLLSKTVYNTTSIEVTGGIPNNRTLYWRVRPYSEWDACTSPAPQQIGVFRTQSASAVNELATKMQVTLSPNPVSSGQPATLGILADEAMEMILQLQDLSGRVYEQQSLRLSEGENNLLLPNQNLPAGLYVIVLKNEQGRVFRKMSVLGEGE